MYVGFSISVVSVKHKFPICYGTCAGSGHVTPSPRHTQHTFKSVCFSVSYQANTLDLCTTEKELKCENIILLSTLMQSGGQYTGLHILGSTLSLDAVQQESLAGIKFDDFGQNTVLFNLVNFKFGDSVPQPKNDVTTTMQASWKIAI